MISESELNWGIWAIASTGFTPVTISIAAEATRHLLPSDHPTWVPRALVNNAMTRIAVVTLLQALGLVFLTRASVHGSSARCGGADAADFLEREHRDGFFVFRGHGCDGEGISVVSEVEVDAVNSLFDSHDADRAGGRARGNGGMLCYLLIPLEGMRNY